MKVHVYPDETLGILHGPRLIARLTAKGEPMEPMARAGGVTAAASVAPRSVPSRRGLAASASEEGAARRPTLTAPSRGAKQLPCPNPKTRAA